MMINIKNFQKTFLLGIRRKKSVAARDISLSVEQKEIFGFLGPNGAGKTTTIKALLGLIRADAGELRILGHEVSSMEWRTQVGYMPEHPNFYDYLSGFEMVVWFGKLFGLVRHEAEKEAKRHLERVGLGHAMNRRLRGYSKGMLQRAGLAQSLIGSPKLLILDEPMTGLDPIGRRDMRELLLDLRDEGRTVFYSTHILPDIEMTCDRVTIIDKGVTKRSGRLQEILTETTRGVSVVVSGLSQEKIQSVIQEHKDATVADGALQVEFADAESARKFLSEAQASGAQVVSFTPHRQTLEQIFLTSLGGDSEAAQEPVAPGSPPGQEEPSEPAADLAQNAAQTDGESRQEGGA